MTSTVTPAVEIIQGNPQVKESLALVERAKSIQVRSIEERTLAAEFGRKIAGADKWFEEFIEPMKRTAAEAHKAICTQENSVRGPLKEAKQYLSSQIGTFDQEQERLRREEEARLQEEARVTAEAEAQRVANEQAIDDAVALEQAGDTKAAEAVLNNPVPVPVYVPPVILAKQTPKCVGVSSAQNWKFRITDVNKIPREYMIPDQTAIGQVVRALKGKTVIPGIEVYPEGAARFRA